MAEPIRPGNHFVWYGDGSQAQFLKFHKTTNSNGVEFWHFLLRPSKDIMFKYNLKEDEDTDPELGVTIRRYPRHKIKVLDNDPNHMRILVKTDFDGNSTELSREMDYKDSEIESLHKTINSLRALIAQKDQENELMANNVEEWMKRNKRIIDKAQKSDSTTKKLEQVLKGGKE